MLYLYCTFGVLSYVFNLSVCVFCCVVMTCFIFSCLMTGIESVKYACVCVYVYVCTWMYVYIGMCVCKYVRTYVDVCMYILV
jgi:hypothetical protein